MIQGADLFRGVVEVVRTLDRRIRSVTGTMYFRWRNLTCRHSMLAPGGPVVSLTTYGRRTNAVHTTLESIARGRAKPRRIILWISDPEVFADPPRALRRLQDRGLEVLFSRDYGPHKKYYPYVHSSASGLSVPLVTADDDVLYPKDWLERLVERHQQYPVDVIAHRARNIIGTDSHVFAPYASWVRAPAEVRSPRIFPTGVGGVLYPTAVQEQLRSQGDVFMDFCPRADDLWLHVNTIRCGAVAQQLSARRSTKIVPVWPDLMPGLWVENVVNDANDVQAFKTYSRQEMRSIVRGGPEGHRFPQ